MMNTLTIPRSLTHPATLCLAGALFAALIPSHASALAVGSNGTTNNATQFVINVDGQFTGSNNGQLLQFGEWSDVTPVAFISTPVAATPTFLSDPLANSFLYAAVGPGVALTNDALYLMYDYSGRTTDFTNSANGSFIADVSFPLTVNGRGRTNITVQFRVGQAVACDLDGDGFSDVSAASLGLDGDVGFGPGPHNAASHMLIELEVPLLIPSGFGSGFPQGGVAGDGNGNGYSPAPSFWGASAEDNAGDPPISSGIFTINPNGSTLIQPQVLLGTPEPATLSIAAISTTALLLRRRRNAH